MKIVGLTGGMGSGKTTVSKMFEKLGVTVYIADAEAKNIMQTDATVKSALIKNFGEKAYENNSLNTAYLAEIVFKDKQKLNIINSIVHPVVKKHFKEFLKLQTAKYLLFENAILFENGFDELCDYIVTVVAPLELRISRIQKRDGYTRSQILDRISKQWDDNQKIQKSDFVIYNDDLKILENQVNTIHSKLLKIIESSK
ncbi:MAG: dephospho-CoA kinase [Bacteroidetes bacterium]|nr:dephospho-CoA kinase [Bacteroidota bacterium]